MSLAVGAKFPVEIPVQARRGPVTLAEMTASGPLVVAFHRLWCPFCQQAARDLTAVKGQLDKVGAGVVIIYREDADTACDSCAQRGIPFECLSDPDRELEQATEVEQFSIGRYAAFSPTDLVSALRSGSPTRQAKVGIPTGPGHVCHRRRRANRLRASEQNRSGYPAHRRHRDGRRVRGTPRRSPQDDLRGETR